MALQIQKLPVIHILFSIILRCINKLNGFTVSLFSHLDGLLRPRQAVVGGPGAREGPSTRSAKAISRLADPTNRSLMNVRGGMTVMADCLQSRGIPHVNPDE